MDDKVIPQATVQTESSSTQPTPEASKEAMPGHGSATPLQTATSETSSPPTPSKPESSAHFFRHLAEFVVVLIMAVLFFRLFFAEAYFVPTGSMAPTIVGNHLFGECPACGYPVRVGLELDNVSNAPATRADSTDGDGPRGTCPNCGLDRLTLGERRQQPGDRLLVHKGIFTIRSPRRWETIVFRNPHPKPGEKADAFIKRVVGLPGEAIQIRDGDIFINGYIARKSLADLRGLRVLVDDHDYLPRDATDSFRWTCAAGSAWQHDREARQFQLTLTPTSAAEYDWLRYRHLVRESHAEEGPTTWREGPLLDQLGYNRDQPRDHSEVHDLLVQGACKVTGNGWFALAATDGYEDVLAEIPVGGTQGQTRVTYIRRPAASASGPQRRAGNMEGGISFYSAYHLAHSAFEFEFGLVDRRIVLTINGKPILAEMDLTEPPLESKRQPLHAPLTLGGWGPVSLAGKGLHLDVGSLRLYRDLHYTNVEGCEPRFGIEEPVYLGDDAFFVLGDNSASSYDSRRWKGGPEVRQEHLIGKPFLLHLPAHIVQWEPFGNPSALALPDWKRIKMLR